MNCGGLYIILFVRRNVASVYACINLCVYRRQIRQTVMIEMHQMEKYSLYIDMKAVA